MDNDSYHPAVGRVDPEQTRQAAPVSDYSSDPLGSEQLQQRIDGAANDCITIVSWLPLPHRLGLERWVPQQVGSSINRPDIVRREEGRDCTRARGSASLDAARKRPGPGLAGLHKSRQLFLL